MAEQFHDRGPFSTADDDEVMCIEKDAEKFPAKVGLLWSGSTWLTVNQARDLRDWLDKVIP